jgi:hypothetical protein
VVYVGNKVRACENVARIVRGEILPRVNGIYLITWVVELKRDENIVDAGENCAVDIIIHPKLQNAPWSTRSVGRRMERVNRH